MPRGVYDRSKTKKHDNTPAAHDAASKNAKKTATKRAYHKTASAPSILPENVSATKGLESGGFTSHDKLIELRQNLASLAQVRAISTDGSVTESIEAEIAATVKEIGNYRSLELSTLKIEALPKELEEDEGKIEAEEVETKPVQVTAPVQTAPASAQPVTPPKQVLPGDRPPVSFNPPTTAPASFGPAQPQ